MTKTILYIDDSTTFRNLALESLQNSDYSNFQAPNSISEVHSIIESNIFVAALIDFDLKTWVGKNYESVLQIDGIDIHDGIELAEYLLSLNSNTKVGVYSTNAQQLNAKLSISKVKDKIEFVPIKQYREDVTQFAPDFFDKVFKIKSIVYPVFDSTALLPIEIESFYNKKVLKSLNRGQYIWKAGKFAWLASVNDDIDNEALGQSMNKAIVHRRQEFEIGLDKTDFQPAYIHDKTSNNMTTIKNLLDKITGVATYQQNSLIHEMFLLKYATKMYIQRQFPLDKLKLVIGRLSLMAKFESQKLLFKGYLENENNFNLSKEDIYERLEVFFPLQLPKILDIYKGVVSDIQDKKVSIKLTSLSDTTLERLEFFSKDMLEKYNLEEDGEFEYTIYKPSIGGSAYHIEPI